MCDLYDKDNFFTDLLLIIEQNFLFSFHLTDTFLTPELGERQKKAAPLSQRSSSKTLNYLCF